MWGNEGGRMEMRKTKGRMKDAMIKYWSAVNDMVDRVLSG